MRGETIIEKKQCIGVLRAQAPHRHYRYYLGHHRGHLYANSTGKGYLNLRNKEDQLMAYVCPTALAEVPGTLTYLNIIEPLDPSSKSPQSCPNDFTLEDREEKKGAGGRDFLTTIGGSNLVDLRQIGNACSDLISYLD